MCAAVIVVADVSVIRRQKIKVHERVCMRGPGEIMGEEDGKDHFNNKKTKTETVIIVEIHEWPRIRGLFAFTYLT